MRSADCRRRGSETRAKRKGNITRAKRGRDEQRSLSRESNQVSQTSERHADVSASLSNFNCSSTHHAHSIRAIRRAMDARRQPHLLARRRSTPPPFPPPNPHSAYATAHTQSLTTRGVLVALSAPRALHGARIGHARAGTRGSETRSLSTGRGLQGKGADKFRRSVRNSELCRCLALNSPPAPSARKAVARASRSNSLSSEERLRSEFSVLALFRALAHRQSFACESGCSNHGRTCPHRPSGGVEHSLLLAPSPPTTCDTATSAHVERVAVLGVGGA
jgi:hypothetical protein